ncbi:MAG: cation:proton antiporter family protein [Granulosicoccus sp.]
MEPLVIVLAFVAGLVFRYIGYPPLLGYLLAGFVAHAFGFGSFASLQPFADAGILLLLFTIGLKLKLRSLAPRYVWGSALLHMLVVVPLTAAVIYAISRLYEPLSFTHPAAPWTVAFALSFSSTVLAIKLFEERGETASFYARIAIGILVVQDVLAVIYLVFTSGHLPSVWALALLMLPLLRPWIDKLLLFVGHGELLLLAGVLFAFGSAGIFEAVDVKGGLGALVMGMLIVSANPGKARELYDQFAPLRSLLLIGFFLQIGYYGLPSLAMGLVAVLLAVLITLRPVIYFLLLNLFGLRARTGWLTGLSLFNYSEFGLIVAALAVKQGILAADWITTIALALALSYFVATPVNKQALSVYRRYASKLSHFERARRLPEEEIGSLGNATTVILGLGRVGRGAYDALRNAGHERIIGVDENYEKVCQLNETGYPAIHGDASDRDFWERTKLAKCNLLLVSLSNHQENLCIAKMARELGFDKTLAVVARFPDERVELEALGCVSYYLYEDVGRDFAAHTLSSLK